jgi:hypothetical protein
MVVISLTNAKDVKRVSQGKTKQNSHISVMKEMIINLVLV